VRLAVYRLMSTPMFRRLNCTQKTAKMAWAHEWEQFSVACVCAEIIKFVKAADWKAIALMAMMHSPSPFCGSTLLSGGTEINSLADGAQGLNRGWKVHRFSRFPPPEPPASWKKAAPQTAKCGSFNYFEVKSRGADPHQGEHTSPLSLVPPIFVFLLARSFYCSCRR